MSEFNLSDNIWLPQHVLEVRYVKEFIKRLKEELPKCLMQHRTSDIERMNHEIAKLAGEKLI